MSHFFKSGVLMLACILPISAEAQNTPQDAAKAGDASKTAEPAMKVDSATKGTTGEAIPAPSNKMAPGAQRAGSGTGSSSSPAAPAPTSSDKMKGDSAPK
jgi:hypothetical protein